MYARFSHINSSIVSYLTSLYVSNITRLFIKTSYHYLSPSDKYSPPSPLPPTVPKVMIVPVGDRYVKAGSTVKVDCQITDVVQLPDYIFWYHEDKRVMDRRDPNLLVSEI